MQAQTFTQRMNSMQRPGYREAIRSVMIDADRSELMLKVGGFRDGKIPAHPARQAHVVGYSQWPRSSGASDMSLPF